MFSNAFAPLSPWGRLRLSTRTNDNSLYTWKNDPTHERQYIMDGTTPRNHKARNLFIQDRGRDSAAISMRAFIHVTSFAFDPSKPRRNVTF